MEIIIASKYIRNTKVSEGCKVGKCDEKRHIKEHEWCEMSFNWAHIFNTYFDVKNIFFDVEWSYWRQFKWWWNIRQHKEIYNCRYTNSKESLSIVSTVLKVSSSFQLTQIASFCINSDHDSSSSFYYRTNVIITTCLSKLVYSIFLITQLTHHGCSLKTASTHPPLLLTSLISSS